mgnify:CR=1 FL=1
MQNGAQIELKFIRIIFTKEAIHQLSGTGQKDK